MIADEFVARTARCENQKCHGYENWMWMSLNVDADLDEVCRAENMQTNSHVGNTGGAATNPSTATEKKQTHAEPSAMVQAKTRPSGVATESRHLVVQSHLLWGVLHALTHHGVLAPRVISMRVTKHFLQTGH